MFHNYLKMAWRQWRSSISYSLITLGGLTAGLTVTLLIGLWIMDELSFDHYFTNHSRIVRVMGTRPSDAGPVTDPLMPPPLIAELRANHDRFFQHLAIVFPNFPHVLTAGETKITAAGEWTQPEWPEILHLKMIRGSRDALKDPSSALIDQSTATALFGAADAMGGTIRIDNSVNVKVAGIYEDFPANTSFTGTHILLPWDKAPEEMPWMNDVRKEWDAAGFWIFGELNDPAGRAAADMDIKDILSRHLNGAKEQLSLYPMDRWHLYSEFRDGQPVSGRIRIVRLFTIIGFFVLLLACINFMNLSTARSVRRAREIGIRKTLGSLRPQLVRQFLIESMLMVTVAFVLSIGLVFLLLPFFDRLAGKRLAIPWGVPLFWLFCAAFIFLAGLVAGSYPAFYLSGFQPVRVLKGNQGNPTRTGRSTALARGVLVVLQFTVSVSLIIGTIVVYRQIQYAKDRPVGYNRENLLAIRMNTSDIYSTSYMSLREDLLRTEVVDNMAMCSNAATEKPQDLGEVAWEGKDPASKPSLTVFDATHDFGSTLGWTIAAGRDFSRDFATDSTAVILNETAARLIGWKDPIGKTIRFWGQDHHVIGLAKDMVMGSPYQPVQATIFALSYFDKNYILIRVKAGSPPMSAALNKIAAVFKKYNPQAPFEFRLIADDYALKFAAEQQVARLAAVFAILAIFISCLGLFGLASYLAEQRTKEIGVRKVLGASVSQLVILLSADFLKLITIALVISIPLSAWCMYRWLQDYPYHTRLTPWIFFAAAAAAIGLTLLTVSTRALRAARANPVNSLRQE